MPALQGPPSTAAGSPGTALSPSPGSPLTPTPGPWTGSCSGVGGCSSPPCWSQDRPKSAATSRQGRGTAWQGWVLLYSTGGFAVGPRAHSCIPPAPWGCVWVSCLTCLCWWPFEGSGTGWAPPTLCQLCPLCLGLHYPQQRAVDPPASTPGHHQRPRPCRAHPAPAGESPVLPGDTTVTCLGGSCAHPAGRTVPEEPGCSAWQGWDTAVAVP